MDFRVLDNPKGLVRRLLNWSHEEILQPLSIYEGSIRLFSSTKRSHPSSPFLPNNTPTLAHIVQPPPLPSTDFSFIVHHII